MPQDDDYIRALIEDLDDRFDLILATLNTVKNVPSDLHEAQRSLANIESSLDIFYAVIKEQGWLIKDHQSRLARLESP